MNFDEQLRPGDGVLDLGANVGSYAEKYAKRVGETGCVIAVEPDPETARHARQRLERFPHATVMTVAIDRELGTRRLYRDSESARNSLWLDNVLDRKEDNFIDVNCVTLDFLAAMVPNLRGIKMDLQGAEMLALQGGTETLKRTNLVWAVEVWPDGLMHAGSSVDELSRVFEAAGYESVGLGDRWDQVRANAPTQRGHSAMDVVLIHRTEAGSEQMRA